MNAPIRCGMAGGLLAILLLAGCATPVVPPVPFDGPHAWQRSIEIAEAEWTTFGEQVVAYRYDANGREIQLIDPTGYTEDDRPVYPSMVGYWNAVGEDGFDSWASCYAGWQRKCPWHLPWSAAFISWVMVEAGMPADRFVPNENHWTYVQNIVARAGDPGRAFLPEAVDRYRPQPGDLICKTRGGAETPDFDVLMKDPGGPGEFLPMHCDLVIANGGSRIIPDGFIEAIGGNVANSVSKSLIPSDKGYLIPGRVGAWFIILRNVYRAPPLV
ncbi:MAG: DUF2272 domain-containing protein [Dongiaceae bacterium]